MYVIQGTVHAITPTQAYGQKGFRKRDLVIEADDGRWTNYIPIEFTNDGCEAIDDVRPGDEVKIEFSLGGRKWQKDPDSEVRYFLAAKAIRHRVTKQDSFNDDASSQGSAVEDEEVPF